MNPIRRTLTLALAVAAPILGCAAAPVSEGRQRPTAAPTPAEADEVVALPEPDATDGMSLAEALARRRSLREYGLRSLTEQELSQLLWAAQGITDSRGFRTAPSAGATYPLDTYVVTADGHYRYEPQGHRLHRLGRRDLRPELAVAALRQTWVGEAPAVFVLSATYARIRPRYGGRSERYTDMEIGHAAQNLLLQAVALGLGGVPVGAFHEDEVRHILSLPADELPLYILPVGRQR